MTRVLAIALFVTIAVTFVLAEDLNLGGPVPNDHSVRNATVIRKPRPFGRRVVVALHGRSNITSIRAVDHNVTNNASVSVVKGGLGHPVVLLRFQAPPHRGLNFTVEVRGVRVPKPTRPPPPPPSTRPPPPPPSTTLPPSPPETTVPETTVPETTVPVQEGEEEEEEVEQPYYPEQVYFTHN